jgi:cytochrome b subunit of formate dehydrogenase
LGGLEVVHGVIAMLFIAVMLAHIYIDTIGMEGAFEAMGTGPQLGEGAPQPVGRGRSREGRQ